MNVEQQIAKAMKKVYTAHKDLVRDTVIRFADNVAMNTPVHTGYARLNWNIGVGSVDTSVKPQSGKDEKYPAPDMRAKATEALAGYDGKKTVYVSNHLPYIVRLNEGWSKLQQPNPGWVEASAMLAKRQAQAAASRGQK